MAEGNQDAPTEGTDADESSLRKELQALRLTLQRLREELQCGVCRSTLTTPVCLPCGHAFCSECARRFLLTRSRCLEAHCATSATTAELRPVRALEAVVRALSGESPTRSVSPNQPVRGRIAQLVNPSRTLLVSSLRSLGLRTEGTLDQLAKRHREFVLLWNVNLDAETPLPENAIAARVMNAERNAASEAMRGNTRSITNLFRRRPAARDSGCATNQEIPEEGDSFGALISKIRRRENRAQPNVQSLRQTEPLEKAVHGPIPHSLPQETLTSRDPNPPRSAQNESGLNTNQRPERTEAANGNDPVREASSSPRTQSPTSSDLMLINAADCASGSQDVPPSMSVTISPHVDFRTAPRAERWDPEDSQSTLAPSPVRPILTANSIRLHERPQYKPNHVEQNSRESVVNSDFFRSSAVHALESKTPAHVSGTVSSVPQNPQRSSQRYGAGNITIRPRINTGSASSAHPTVTRTPTKPPRICEAQQELASTPSFVGPDSRHVLSPVNAKPSTSSDVYGTSACVHAPNVTSTYQSRSSTSLHAEQLPRRTTPIGPYVSNSVQPSSSQLSSTARQQLSEEQRIRIEQNRLRAIERQRAAKKRRLEQMRDPN